MHWKLYSLGSKWPWCKKQACSRTLFRADPNPFLFWQTIVLCSMTTSDWCTQVINTSSYCTLWPTIYYHNVQCRTHVTTGQLCTNYLSFPDILRIDHFRVQERNVYISRVKIQLNGTFCQWPKYNHLNTHGNAPHITWCNNTGKGLSFNQKLSFKRDSYRY